jgi:hypothetical protein
MTRGVLREWNRCIARDRRRAKGKVHKVRKKITAKGWDTEE